MPTLLNPSDAAALRHRLECLPAQATRRWGSMDLAAMLCHVGDGMAQALGRRPAPDQSNAFLRTVVKRVALSLPMPKGAPTAPSMDAGKEGTRLDDFEAARRRALGLLDETLGFPAGQGFAPHPAFGPMTREQRGVLTWKHIDHHLRQFGA